MTEVTKEDREAAFNIHDYVHVEPLEEFELAFARHREASTEALQTEVEALRAETVCPFCNGDAATFDSARTGEFCAACGDQGKVPAMAAKYLIGVRLFYDMAEAEVQALRAENARLREALNTAVVRLEVAVKWLQKSSTIVLTALENRDD